MHPTELPDADDHHREFPARLDALSTAQSQIAQRIAIMQGSVAH
ncbi:MAG TPA: hypothetical protein VM099_00795 [Gemmatimonadaceae bacterium]|nr:hypothetical protein [Gemmatimonadaceae bacterium]